jgi:hypothetical protein
MDAMRLEMARGSLEATAAAAAAAAAAAPAACTTLSVALNTTSFRPSAARVLFQNALKYVNLREHSGHSCWMMALTYKEVKNTPFPT